MPAQTAPPTPFLPLTRLLTYPKLRDWLSLAAMGILVQGTRRFVIYAADENQEATIIRSTHGGKGQGFEWLLSFWVNDPGWKKRARGM